MPDYFFECNLCDDCFLSLEEFTDEAGCNENDCKYYGDCGYCYYRDSCPYIEERCFSLR